MTRIQETMAHLTGQNEQLRLQVGGAIPPMPAPLPHLCCAAFARPPRLDARVCACPSCASRPANVSPACCLLILDTAPPPPPRTQQTATAQAIVRREVHLREGLKRVAAALWGVPLAASYCAGASAAALTGCSVHDMLVGVETGVSCYGP